MTVKWIARDIIQCSVDGLQCDADCFQVASRELVVILPNWGLKDGQVHQFDRNEIALLEHTLQRQCGIRRWFGITLGKRKVRVMKAEQISPLPSATSRHSSLHVVRR